MIGRTLADRYELVAPLGAGAMGEVFRATQLAVAREVAVKVLHPERAIDEASAARFLREARANSLLASPHTVQLLDFGQADTGELFLVMELLEGESLRARLARVGRLPARDAVDACLQALRSLVEAHAKGVVHRDLKPEHLFFARVHGERGDEEIVKVLDFGVAKLVGEAGRRLNAVETRDGRILGTPRYMSPEQAQARELDARSDLYSLGVVLYEALTGQPPFEGDDAVIVMAKHITRAPIPPATACPEARIPRALDALVMRVLAKDPDDRPPSAEALATELAVAADDTTSSSIAGVGSDGASRSRRPRVGLAALVAVVLAVVVGVVALQRSNRAGASMPPASATPTPAPTPTPTPVASPSASPSTATSAPNLAPAIPVDALPTASASSTAPKRKRPPPNARPPTKGYEYLE